MKEKCPLKLEKICRIPEKAVEIFFIVKLTVAAKPSLYELHPTLPVNKAYWFISKSLIEKERSDFGYLLRRSRTRICLAN